MDALSVEWKRNSCLGSETPQSVLILGSRGMVASAIATAAGARAIKAVRPPVADDAIGFDAQNDDLGKILQGMNNVPKAVVIGFGAAGTQSCASDPIGSRRLNVDRVLAAARTAAKHGSLPVLFSTDGVFDGTDVLWSEQDQARPVYEYGRQRAAVEEAIRTLGIPYLLIRLSRVIADHAGRRDLLFHWCEQLRRGGRVQLATDQVCTPIAAADLGRIAMTLIDSDFRGLIHVAGPERVSAPALFDLLQKSCATIVQLPQVDPVFCRVADLPGLEQRPACTTLNIDRLRQEISPRFTPLEQTVNGVAVAEFAAGGKL